MLIGLTTRGLSIHSKVYGCLGPSNHTIIAFSEQGIDGRFAFTAHMLGLARALPDHGSDGGCGDDISITQALD